MWEPVSDGGASLVQIGSKKNRYALMASYKSLILKLLSIISWLLLFFNYSSSRFFENQPNENCRHLRASGWYYTIIIIFEVPTQNRTKNLKESGYEVGQTLEPWKRVGRSRHAVLDCFCVNIKKGANY